MKLKALFADDDAVSPVIGVILMVAITVILAAVIGAFVLDLGGNQESAPQASWSFEYNDGTNSGWNDGDGDETIEVSHDGGDDIKDARLSYSVGGTSLASGNWVSGPPTTWSAGSTATIDADSVPAETGDDVQIIWEASSGDSSSVIGESSVP